MTITIKNETLNQALKDNKLSGYYIEQVTGDICLIHNKNWKKEFALRWSDAETYVYLDTWRDFSIQEWIDFIREANTQVLDWLKDHKHTLL